MRPKQRVSFTGTKAALSVTFAPQVEVLPFNPEVPLPPYRPKRQVVLRQTKPVKLRVWSVAKPELPPVSVLVQNTQDACLSLAIGAEEHTRWARVKAKPVILCGKEAQVVENPALAWTADNAQEMKVTRTLPALTQWVCKDKLGAIERVSHFPMMLPKQATRH